MGHLIRRPDVVNRQDASSSQVDGYGISTVVTMTVVKQDNNVVEGPVLFTIMTQHGPYPRPLAPIAERAEASPILTLQEVGRMAPDVCPHQVLTG